MCICIYFFRLFSHTGYYNILSTVPVGYLFYMYWYVYVNPKLLIYPSFSPLATRNLFSMSVSLFLFLHISSSVSSFFFKIPHISNIIWYLSYTLWLIPCSMIISGFINVAANGVISFFFVLTSFVWNTIDSRYPKQSWERKMELGESGSLTSDYTINL